VCDSYFFILCSFSSFFQVLVQYARDFSRIVRLLPSRSTQSNCLSSGPSLREIGSYRTWKKGATCTCIHLGPQGRELPLPPLKAT